MLNSNNKVFPKFSVEGVTFTSHGGGSIKLLTAVPDIGSLNEKSYQTIATVDKLAFKTDVFGEYLGLWEAWLVIVKEMGPFAFVVTSHYDREENVVLWENAMGLHSDLSLRVSSLGLSDSVLERKFMAMSPTLAPKTLQLGPKTLPVDAVPKGGVIAEPLRLFPQRDLPPSVEAFMEKQTIAVTLSSFGQIDKLIDFFPEAYQVLFVDSNYEGDSNPKHLHYNGLLDLNSVFAKSAIVVHGCGTGTV